MSAQRKHTADFSYCQGFSTSGNSQVRCSEQLCVRQTFMMLAFITASLVCCKFKTLLPSHTHGKGTCQLQLRNVSFKYAICTGYAYFTPCDTLWTLKCGLETLKLDYFLPGYQQDKSVQTALVWKLSGSGCFDHVQTALRFLLWWLKQLICSE